MGWKKPNPYRWLVDGRQFSQPRPGKAVTSPVLSTILMYPGDDRREEFAPKKPDLAPTIVYSEFRVEGGGR